MSSVVRIAFFLTLLTVGCSGKTESDKNGPSPANAGLSLTAKQFAQEFKDDQEARTAKSDGKVVELTGVVSGYSVPYYGADRGLLDYERNECKGVSCRFRVPCPWKQAAPGQTVRVRGTVSYPIGAYPVELSDCKILEVSGDPPPAFTPDNLPTEHELETKPYWNYISLTGEIAALDIARKYGPEVTLKTKQSEPKVVCEMSIASPDRKKGDDLTSDGWRGQLL